MITDIPNRKDRGAQQGWCWEFSNNRLLLPTLNLNQKKDEVVQKKGFQKVHIVFVNDQKLLPLFLPVNLMPT